MVISAVKSEVKQLGAQRSVAPRPGKFDAPIYVTRPLLPDLEQYTSHLEDIWESGWLSNGGAKSRKLEEALCDYLQAENLSLFNNGTIALITACQALRLSGEVITTPFTFPATPHVLSWNQITPVFADIDPVTMTLDPEKIEPLITSKTSGILGVHVYGMPCAVNAIQEIADFYGLKVVYDAAHAFGTTIDGTPIANFGDATMFSFHATKLFHTAEGGALVLRDPALRRRVELLKNFGIKDEATVIMPGINGKMNELQAALGLITLREVSREKLARVAVAQAYRERLSNIPGLSIFDLPDNVSHSQQYFIVRINQENCGVSRDQVFEQLQEFNIFARRYFHPLCSEYGCYKALPSSNPNNLAVAHRAAQEVLSLPFNGALGQDDAHRICDALEYILGR